jgi:hypothetical protein
MDLLGGIVETHCALSLLLLYLVGLEASFSLGTFLLLLEFAEEQHL